MCGLVVGVSRVDVRDIAEAQGARLDVVLACGRCFVKLNIMGMKQKPNQRKHAPRRDIHSIPGQIENRLAKAALVWERRCQGATYKTISTELGQQRSSKQRSKTVSAPSCSLLPNPRAN
jgi:hypothetical protein